MLNSALVRKVNEEWALQLVLHKPCWFEGGTGAFDTAALVV